MKQVIKCYRVIIDDNFEAFTVFMPSTSEQEAQDLCAGQGEIIQCREYELPIDTNYLRKVLLGKEKGHFGNAETNLIVRLIEQFYVNSIND